MADKDLKNMFVFDDDDDMIDISRQRKQYSPNRQDPAGGSTAHSSNNRVPNKRASSSRQPAPRSTSTRGSYSKGSAPKANKKTKKKKDSLGRSIAKKVGWVFLTIFLLCFFTGTISGVTFLRYLKTDIDSSVNFDLNNLSLNLTSIIYVENQKTGEYYEYTELHSESGNRIWVDFKDIPDNLKNAFKAIEDKRFERHKGVDWKRTVRSIIGMFGSNQQGGSTITQQLIKNLTGDDETTPERKVQEIMRALELEKMYTKDTILESYLNTINLDGRFGVQTASIYYFGKEVKDLSIAECAALAAITKSPTYYNPIKNPENNESRRKLVLREMHDQGYITTEEYEEAKKEELNLVGKDSAQHSVTDIHNYYIDLLIEDVIADLREKYGYTETVATDILYSGGLRIYANMNTTVQNILDEGFVEKNNLFAKRSGDVQPQAAMMVMDYEGNIIGVAGGRGAKDKNRVLNRVRSPRQPGSAIKPLSAYAPSMENNYCNYSSIFSDKGLKLWIGGQKKTWPQNYGGYKYGTVSLEKALKLSLNTIPANLVDATGLETCYEYLTENFHFSSLVENDIAYAPLSVGAFTYGVTVYDMTAAYASIGNLGKYYKPSTYSVITNSLGEIELEKPKEPVQAIKPETAFILNKLLQKVMSDPSGTGYRARLSNMTTFAKTGTTTDYKDRYFVGGTPYHVAALWYGYDRERELSGSDYNHMYAWQSVMNKIDKALNLENKSFPSCSDVEVRWYCTGTGKLATSNCTSKAKGYYSSDNLPGKCSHGGTLLSKISGGSGKSIIGSTKSLSISTKGDEEESTEESTVDSTEKTTGKTTKPAKTTEKPTKKPETTELPKPTETQKPTDKPTEKPPEPQTVDDTTVVIEG